MELFTGFEGASRIERLNTAAEKGRGLNTRCDKRVRLPDAIDARLRVAVLTPKALVARLAIAAQTGTTLLRDLAGRGSFWAFAV